MLEKNVNLMITTKITSSNNGGYIGCIVEYPIMVQSDTIKGLKKKMIEALSLYFLHHKDEMADKI